MKTAKISVALLVLAVFFLLGQTLNGQHHLNTVRLEDRTLLETRTSELQKTVDEEHNAAEVDRQAQTAAIDALTKQIKSLHQTPVTENPASTPRVVGTPRTTTTTIVNPPTTTTTQRQGSTTTTTTAPSHPTTTAPPPTVCTVKNPVTGQCIIQ